MCAHAFRASVRVEGPWAACCLGSFLEAELTETAPKRPEQSRQLFRHSFTPEGLETKYLDEMRLVNYHLCVFLFGLI